MPNLGPIFLNHPPKMFTNFQSWRWFRSNHPPNFPASDSATKIQLKNVIFCVVLCGSGCWTKNRGGFTPQIIHFNRVFHYFNPSILGYPDFCKHPSVFGYVCQAAMVEIVNNCKASANSVVDHPQRRPRHRGSNLSHGRQVGIWGFPTSGELRVDIVDGCIQTYI